MLPVWRHSNEWRAAFLVWLDWSRGGGPAPVRRESGSAVSVLQGPRSRTLPGIQLFPVPIQAEGDQCHLRLRLQLVSLTARESAGDSVQPIDAAIEHHVV